MGQFVVSRTMAAAPSVVFERFADLRNAAKHIDAITRLEVLTDGPIGVGTRFRETRVMFKKEHTEEMEIVEFTKDKSYTVRCDSCGARYETQIRFDATPDGGTRVAMHMSWQALTFFAKLMSPLGRLMAGTMRKCLTQDMDDLAKVIENSDR